VEVALGVDLSGFESSIKDGESQNLNHMFTNIPSAPAKMVAMKLMTINRRWGALSLTEQSRDDRAILYCAGKLVAGREVAGLGAAVQSHPQPNLAIDLARVSAVDAAGLGTLVALYRWATVNGKRLTVANPSRRVRAVMERTGLSYLLEGEHKASAFVEPDELCRCTA
jgi:anti-anti-sigma factor